MFFIPLLYLAAFLAVCSTISTCLEMYFQYKIEKTKLDQELAMLNDPDKEKTDAK